MVPESALDVLALELLELELELLAAELVLGIVVTNGSSRFTCRGRGS
jgi:hypothetical protein